MLQVYERPNGGFAYRIQVGDALIDQPFKPGENGIQLMTEEEAQAIGSAQLQALLLGMRAIRLSHPTSVRAGQGLELSAELLDYQGEPLPEQPTFTLSVNGEEAATFTGSVPLVIEIPGSIELTVAAGDRVATARLEVLK